MLWSGAGFAAMLTMSSAMAATLALFAVARLGSRGTRARRAALRPSPGDGVVFLFDRSDLVDASRAGERLLAAAPRGGTDWARLLALLAPEFPDLASRIESLTAEGRQVYTSSDASARLTAEWREGLRRLTLLDHDISPPQAQIDAHNLAALERELDVLRANTDLAPALVWRQSATGEVTWFNRRYLEELRRLRGPAAADRWPTPALFEPLALSEAVERRAPLRMALEAGGEESWFDIHVGRSGDDLVCSATAIDRLVGAERQLRGFMQTLTKTFADLHVGLAIFDRARRLVVFNPALSDLTGLPPGFLAAHPTLFGMLDRMRDLGRVPEPRNFADWRRRLTDLEANASGGHYCETWALPTGQTVRVSGRPHPDGAVAFIFEDISAEITLTRRFRAELEAGQAVLDTLEDAVAVFSPAGRLAVSNAAYAALWGDDPMARVTDGALADILAAWADRTAPTALWNEAAGFLRAPAGRGSWSAGAMLLDGRSLECRFVPLPGGSAMVRFAVSGALAGDLRFRRRA